MLRSCRYNLVYLHGVKVTDKSCCWKRYVSVSGNPVADRALTAMTGGRIESWLQKYEDLVGLTEVKEAQNKVIEAEGQFQKAQADRRERQQQITTLHGKLKELHAALDKVQRGDERYLALLTEEYEVLREEKKVSASLGEAERAERDGFTALSSAVRESHERERARAERTKYWSIIGSVIGATIGIVGSSVNNYRRNRELRSLVRDSASGGAELRSSINDLVAASRQQVDELRSFIGISPSSPGTVVDQQQHQQASVSSVLAKEIMDAIRQSDGAIEKELTEVKRMIAAAVSTRSSTDATSESPVVYVGPEIRSMLERTEESLGHVIKQNAYLSSAVLYAAGVVTAGVVYGLFRIYGP